MKTYLHRIVASAMNPPQPIHPVLESVFSPSRFKAEPLPGAGPDSLADSHEAPRLNADFEPADAKPLIAPAIRPAPRVAAPRQELPDRPAEEPLIQPSAPPLGPGIEPVDTKPIIAPAIRPAPREAAHREELSDRSPDEPQIQRSAPPVPSNPRRDFAPLFSAPRFQAGPAPVTRPDFPAVVNRKTQTLRIAQSVEPGRPEEPPMAPAIPPAPGVRERRQELPDRSAFEPLTPVSAVPLALDPTRNVEPAPVRATADALQPKGRERRESSTGAPVAQRPSPPADQIEIHIGRIEVTAVPQPVPPAGRRPVRKSLNLNDYLRGVR